ncbi:MAG TPA: TFIIB-type zinc ribbon-containing protein [Candidatus Lokiarchaeia archaeon]|nr:TFIIB-type zinc ribbon-containing protein [Candidatus Lokiarchaeia archaeon]
MNAQQVVHESIITKQPSLDNLTCPECGGHALIEDPHRGELICSECGTVVEDESFDFSQERRAFTAEEVENRKHNGSPISALSDISWTTVIKTTDKNSSSELKRAVKWNSRLSWDKKNLLIAVNEIKRICTNLSLPRIVAETAATFYKKVQKLNVLRGRSINGFVGACVYLACRMNKIPRSVNEIYAEMPTTTDRDIRICYRVLIGELGIKVPRINATALLPRYASTLAITQESTMIAEKILSDFEASTNTAGKDPKGMIAAAIYLACKQTGETKAQKAVACGCLITEVTLRSRIKEFQSICS